MDSTVEQLSAIGGKVVGSVVDVADKAAYQAWITSAGEQLGGIDIFVPNVSAGGGDMSEEGWQKNFNIDLLGTTRGVEAALPNTAAALREAQIDGAAFVTLRHKENRERLNKLVVAAGTKTPVARMIRAQLLQRSALYAMPVSILAQLHGCLNAETA